MERLQVQAHVAEDGTARVSVAGDVDVASSPRLSAELREAVRNVRHLTLDLSNVPFMDSSGIAVLVDIHRILADAGGELSVCAVAPSVLRSLEHAGLTDHFGLAGIDGA